MNGSRVSVLLDEVSVGAAVEVGIVAVLTASIEANRTNLFAACVIRGADVGAGGIARYTSGSVAARLGATLSAGGGGRCLSILTDGVAAVERARGAELRGRAAAKEGAGLTDLVIFGTDDPQIGGGLVTALSLSWVVTGSKSVVAADRGGVVD